MTSFLDILQNLLLLPVIGGSVFSVLCVWAAARFFGTKRGSPAQHTPPITVLKPIYGLDKDLEHNLLTLCRQDYPTYQIVMSVQREDDPALPLLRRLAADFPDRLTLVVKASEPVVNGKVQNLMNGLVAARHDLLVISDSDVRVSPDYLRKIIAPLAEDTVGYVCTLYRSVRADHWSEKMELLSLNADFVPSLIFSAVTGAADFCIGATVAFRKQDLDAIGGLEDLGNYLVEDYELGRRLLKLGKRMVLVPDIVEIVADYPTFRGWWTHQIYWDQNTWAANPTGFALTILTRAVPFALIFAISRGFDPMGTGALLSALAIRLLCAYVVAGYMNDREARRALGWLPVRDVLALISWYIAITRRSFEWRGLRFGLTKDGRIVPRDKDVVTTGNVS